MIIVLKPLSPKEDIERVENMVKARGLDTHVIEGAEMTIIGCIGDTSRIDAKLFEVDPAVTKEQAALSTRTTPSSMCPESRLEEIIWR